MEASQLLARRLANQQIVRPVFKNPHDLVAHLGAVQAQDFASALWTIGLRLPGCTAADVVRAIADRKLVWTWAMRGTLHIVPAEDARWMLRLLAPRALAKTKSVYRQAGLTDELFAHASGILQRALRGGKQLTRKQIMELWEAAGIGTSNQRGYLMLARLAQEGCICLGPPSDKTQTFVLLDEWLPEDSVMTREASLAEIARRYFASHGPATLDDFVWWTGLTRTEARPALEAAMPALTSTTTGDKEYFYPAAAAQALPSPAVSLLPGFDEYMLGYTDRSLALRDAHRQHVYTKNAVYPGTLIIDGLVEGTWKRVVQRRGLQLTVTSFQTLSEELRAQVEEQAKRYSEFWQQDIAVEFATAAP